MANDYVLTRIMDEGKRSFSVEDVPNRDPDIFYSLYVVKLRQLRDRGVIENLLELPNNKNAIVRVDIIGGINLDLE